MSAFDYYLSIWAGTGLVLYVMIYRLRTWPNVVHSIPPQKPEPKPVEGPLLLQLLAGAGGGPLWVVVLVGDLRHSDRKRDKMYWWAITAALLLAAAMIGFRLWVKYR